jgi:hypothetical protein
MANSREPTLSSELEPNQNREYKKKILSFKGKVITLESNQIKIGEIKLMNQSVVDE